MKQSSWLYPKAPLSQTHTSPKFLIRIFSLLFLPLFAMVTVQAQTQVTVTSTTGTGAAGINYSTVGAAFTAINTGGIHTGAITVKINSNTTETTSAILNGSGAGSASYTAILIQPSADAVSVSANFNATGRGIIELNGADNVTIDGDNPNTSGTNKNLTITFSTAQTASQSLVRLATNATVDCNSVTIKNCNLKGNVTNGNISSITSSTSAAALSMAVVVAGGANSATTAPSALVTTGVATIATIGSTANNFTVDNCTINNVGVGVHFYGNTPTSCNLATITNNTIGTAGSLSTFPGGPASTVYFKGIFYRGIKAMTVTGNTIQGICAYFISGPTPNLISAIECNSTFNNGGGTFNISNNTITGIWSNNAAVASTTQIARGISMLGSAATTNIICNSNSISNIKSNTVSNTTNIAAVAIDLGSSTTSSSIVVSNNDINTIYASKSWGATGISLSTGGNNGHIYNNRISNISMGAGSTATNSIVAGIRLAAGISHKVYHNSVLLNAAFGNYQHLSACFVGLVTTASANIDIRNNIFANYSTTTGNTTSADAAIILNSALTSSSNYTINNNAYFGPIAPVTNYLGYLYNTTSFANPGSSNSFAYAAFSEASTTPATNFRSFSSTLKSGGTNDNASFAATLANPSPFAASTDLHISTSFANNTGGTHLESKGASGLSVSGAGLSTDFEGDTRNGPSGSVHGGATAPDLGADEFDGKPFVADCSGTPAAGTVTGSGISIYCTSGAPASRTFMLSGHTTNVESIVIQWEASVTSSITGFITLTGENADTYTTTAAPSQTTWYRAAVICTKSGITSYQTAAAITELTTEKRWVGGTGNWNVPTNWVCGVPATGDAVVIDNGNPHLDVNFDVSNSLIISGTGQLTVNPTSTLSVTATGAADFGGKSVVFKSTAAATASLGKVSGSLINATNVTVERYIPQNTNRAWRLLTSPAYGQTIKEAWQENQDAGMDGITGYGTNITSSSAAWAANGFDFKTGSTSLLSYNASTNALIPVTNTGASIDDEPGYFIYIRGNRSITPSSSVVAGAATTLRTTGTINTGTQPNITVLADKFALVGNPYPSALDVRNITLGGGSFGSSYYVWDPKLLGSYNLGAYQTLVESGGNYVVIPGGGSFGSSGSVNNTIESGAAFLVQAVGSNGTVSINENSKASGSRMVFRPSAAPTQILNTTLLAKNNGQYTVADGTMVLFDDSYDNAVDASDNKKLNNFSESMSILKKGSNLIVEKRQPVVTDDTVFFKMIYLKKIDYKLQVVAAGLNQAGTTGFLEDSYTGTHTTLNLNDTTVYDFTVDNNAASSAAARFSIVFRPSVVLPVTFTSINASSRGKKVAVNWQVSNQINISNYGIEKSTNGRDFAAAAVQIGPVANSVTASYNWVDENPATGNNYYRIKSIDLNGAYKYSNVVKISVGKLNPSINISPNPVQGNIASLRFTDLEKGSYTIKVNALNGKLVYSSKQLHAGDDQTYSIQLPAALASGIYQVEVSGANSTIFNQKLIVTNK